MMTAAQGRRERKRLWREINREARIRARELLGRLRREIKETRLARKDAAREMRRRCRDERARVRERVRQMRLEAKARLREAVTLEKSEARGRCTAAKDAAKLLGDALAQKRAELEAERTFRREMRQIEAGNARRKKEHKRASSTERRQESDDEVRQNVPPELLGVFERVRGHVRGSDRMTRTEAFLKWAEEHPREVLGEIEREAEARAKELQADRDKIERALRKKIPKNPPPSFTVEEGEDFASWLELA